MLLPRALLLLACGGPAGSPPARVAAAVPPAPTSGGSTPVAIVPGPVLSIEPDHPCGRPPDFAEWPGGRALRLDVASVGSTAGPTAPLDPTSAVGVTVAGADPDEALELWVGDLCALDCPIDRDGACFQPAGAALVTHLDADATGSAEVQVIADASWGERWLVFQVTAPGRRALSQAVVDRLDGWHAPFGTAGAAFEISPVTLHAQFTADGDEDILTMPVAAGRTVRITKHTAGPGDDDGDRFVLRGGLAEFLPIADDVPLDVPTDQPASIWWLPYFDYFAGEYALDFATAPLAAPADWYPDLDGDGYGDPAGIPVPSASPVADASPNTLDCDDGDPERRPGAGEVCGDGLDQDCDGVDRPCAAGSRYAGRALGNTGQGVAFGDVDGDGAIDLVSMGDETAIFTAVGAADRVAPSMVLGDATAVAVGDLTGDGAADLLMGTIYELEVYEGPLTAPVIAADAVATIDPARSEWRTGIGDVSGDGVADLVLSDASASAATLEVYLGPLAGAGLASDGALPISDDGLSRPDVTLGDADGDGLVDVWTHEVCLYLAPVDLVGGAPVGCADDGIDDNLALAGIDAADADGDGRADVVVGDPEGARVFLGPLAPGTATVADATWALADEPAAAGSWWHAGVTADRDGDDAAEIVLLVDDLVWTVSAAAGVWTRADGEVVMTGTSTSGVVQGGDFDGDGSGDIAVGQWAHWDTTFGTGVVTLLWGP